MILKADDIVKTYRKSRNNQSIFKLQIEYLEIEEGSFTAVLGPNGSGKSTFLKIILYLLFADQGTIRLLGHSHKDKKSRKGVSYLPENFSFPKSFTVKKALEIFGNIGTAKKQSVGNDIDSLARAFDVHFLDRKIKNLSKGMKQITALMNTLIGNHRFYILDEPFNGLDAVQKKKVMDYLLQLKKKKNISVLITTHILSDIEKLCDTVHLIQFGSIIHSASKKAIQKDFSSIEEYYLHHFDTQKLPES